MVTQVDEILAIFILCGSTVGEVDDLGRSGTLILQESNQILLEEINCNCIMM